MFMFEHAPYRSSDYLTEYMKNARRTYMVTPQSAFGIPFESIEVTTNDGLRICGWFIPGETSRGGKSVADKLGRNAPQFGALKRAGVVIHHHFGGQKVSTLGWIRIFHEMGLPVVAIDGRGHGLSDSGRSEHVTFGDRARDVEAAVDWLGLREIDFVIGVGQSQGAAAIAIAAARYKRIRAVVLESGPSAEMLSATWGLAGLVARRRSLSTRVALSWQMLKVSQPVNYSIEVWTALWRLRNQPLLWIHGDADRVIPIASAYCWYGALMPRSGLWRRILMHRVGHLECLRSGQPRILRSVQELLARTNPLQHVTME